MAHDVYINAINSKANIDLKKILDQWEQFIITIDSLSHTEQGKIIKSILIENELIQPLNKKLPLLIIPSDQVNNILFTQQPTAKVYFFLINRLKDLNQAYFYSYQIRISQQPITVFVWSENGHTISKRLKKKLIPIHRNQKLL